MPPMPNENLAQNLISDQFWKFFDRPFLRKFKNLPKKMKNFKIFFDGHIVNDVNKDFEIFQFSALGAPAQKFGGKIRNFKILLILLTIRIVSICTSKTFLVFCF